MQITFDLTFGIIEKCTLSTALLKLSQYSNPVFKLERPNDGLAEFLPSNYELDWWGKKISSRSHHYQLNTWLYFALILLNKRSKDGKEYRMGSRRRFVALWCSDWAKKFPYDPSDPSGANTGNQFAWYDMAAGIRAGVLGHLLSFDLKGLIDEKTLKTLERSAGDHLTYLREPSLWRSHSNHGMYQSMGLLALIAQKPDISGTPDNDRHLAIQRISAYLSIALSSDGVHLEHSPAYHSLIIRALQSIVVLLDPARDDEKFLIDTFAHLQDAQAAMFMPNGVLAPFGDSRLMEASRLKPENVAILHRCSPKMQYLLTNGETGERTVDDLYYSSEGGFASFKTDDNERQNSFLGASGWFHSLVHKQLDDLSIIWAENNMLILTDPGLYAYEGETRNASELRARGFYYKHPKRIYVESAHGHNTVEIDNETDNRREAAAYQSAFTTVSKAGQDTVVLDTDIIRQPMVRQQRLSVYVPGEVLVVIDELESIDNKPHDFTQWWQFFPAWKVNDSLGNGQISLTFDPCWKEDIVFHESAGNSDVDLNNLEDEGSKRYRKFLSDPDIAVRGAYACASLDGKALPMSVKSYRGIEDEDGKLKGWTSLSPGKLTPAPSVAVSMNKPAKKVVMIAVYKIQKTSNIGHSLSAIKFELDSGDMKTVSWTDGSDVQKIGYRRTGDALELRIGDGPKTMLDRELHPRNEEAQALMYARAAIARKASPDEVFSYFDIASRRSWPPAISEAAKYANKIGDGERGLVLSKKAYEVGGKEEILPFAISLMSVGSSRDLEQAELVLQEAAESNIRAAYYYLGELFQKPKFIKADIEKAKAAYRSGAQLNHSGAILRLAEIFEEQGLYDDAIIWFKKAAGNNNQKAQLKLAEFHTNKKKLPEIYDPKVALHYYVMAADGGNKLAGFNGSKLALNKSLDIYDHDLGKRLLRIASDAGSGIASFNLAKLLLTEKNADMDDVKMLFKKAKSAGFTEAKSFQ